MSIYQFISAEFIDDENRKMHSFPFTNFRNASFIAELAPHYSLSSEIVDVERRKPSTIVRKTFSTKLPQKLLSVAVAGFRISVSSVFAPVKAAASEVSSSEESSEDVQEQPPTSPAETSPKLNGLRIVGLNDEITDRDISIILEPLLGPFLLHRKE